jgi:hypothetical protein
MPEKRVSDQLLAALEDSNGRCRLPRCSLLAMVRELVERRQLDRRREAEGHEAATWPCGRCGERFSRDEPPARVGCGPDPGMPEAILVCSSCANRREVDHV